METGLTYSSTVQVNSTNTALALGSGDMEVFATPALVGAMIQTSHLKPSGLNEEVTATAELTEIEGRKLTFKISASDSKGLVGEGTHIRYIVDRERFLSKL